MAFEFCQPCKPNTKKKCARCPRCKAPPETTVDGYLTEFERIGFMGKVYWAATDEDEEHF